MRACATDNSSGKIERVRAHKLLDEQRRRRQQLEPKLLPTQSVALPSASTLSLSSAPPPPMYGTARSAGHPAAAASRVVPSQLQAIPLQAVPKRSPSDLQAIPLQAVPATIGFSEHGDGFRFGHAEGASTAHAAHAARAAHAAHAAGEYEACDEADPEWETRGLQPLTVGYGASPARRAQLSRQYSWLEDEVRSVTSADSTTDLAV